MFTPALPRRASLALLSAVGLLLAGRAAGGGPEPKKLNDKVKEIAGTAEFLRSVPKHFATLQAVDVPGRRVTLQFEGEAKPKVWALVPDAEVKVMGWWGRLDQFQVGDRVWVWLKTDRKKRPVAVSMLADEISEQDIHGPGVKVVGSGHFGNPQPDEQFKGTLTIKPVKGPSRELRTKGPLDLKSSARVYVQSAAGRVRLLLSPEAFEAARAKQKAALRERWVKEGLPGSVAFVHVFSGEMDLMLDHEAMRWGRSLKVGDKVTLKADPPIKALVKSVQPWRERTQVRLVVHSFDLADLSPGQRLPLLRTPPPESVDSARFPPDLDRPRSKRERVEWFLASIYCTCKVMGDRCTGHFYTLASCNPNGCGMPNHMRRVLAEKIDRGLTDRQIFEELLKEHGPTLLRPHLLP
jgi:hypothetical protein